MNFQRQLDLFNPDSPENQVAVALIGVGTIGSWTALGLSKLGLKSVLMYDGDKIEGHNIPNQVYPEELAGESKVAAMQGIIESLSGVHYSAIPRMWGQSVIPSMPTGRTIIISAVDSMAVRKELWEYAKTHPLVELFIDGRTGGNVLKVYSVCTGVEADRNFYETTLHSDDLSFIKNDEARAASDIPCTARSIVDTSMMCASLIINQVRMFLTGKELSRETIIDLLNHWKF